MKGQIQAAQPLKVGTETCSLMNYAMSGTNLIPEVGMGATMLCWSDRYPYTIHKVSENGKSIWVSPDTYVRTDNTGYFSENQEYEYFNNNQDNPDAWVEYTLRKNGRWVRRGDSLKGTSIRIGKREMYCDPTF